MQIQLNTDHNIEGHAALTTHVNGVVEAALSRISGHITRVEVHLTDDIGQSSGHKANHKSDHKTGQKDKRCVMEARLEGHQPIAVTHHAASMHQAVEGAADKLNRALESTLGRLRDQKRSAPHISPSGSESEDS